MMNEHMVFVAEDIIIWMENIIYNLIIKCVHFVLKNEGKYVISIKEI